MWRKLLEGRDAWEKLARGFEKKYVRPWLQPSRDRGGGKSEPQGPPTADERALPRRAASAVKAAVRRQLKRVRKRSWLLVKSVSALLPLPLEEARANAADAGLVALDRKLYNPDPRQLRREMRRTRRTMARLHRSRLPIIVGPWLSEIGFELLYWIPFLYWARANAKLKADQLWIVSRGGTEHWYGHLADHYIDVFDHYSPEEFRERNHLRIAEQGGLKHKRISDFDREIIDLVEQQVPGRYAKLLHPSLMYNLFQPYFLKNAPVRLVEAFSFYRPISAVTAPSPPEHLSGLPTDYVAVKFYGNDALPDTADNRRFVAELLGRLTTTTEVVSLDGSVRYDDHEDFRQLAAGRIHTIDHLTTPRNNLAVQTEVIRRARAFYCTYGGFSYLAPLCGTATTTFYSDREAFKVEHLELARRVFELLDTPPFAVFDLGQLDALRRDLSVLSSLAS